MSTVEADSLNVVLVEDQALVRDGIARLLGLHDRVRVVGAFETAEDALAGLAALDVDVILADIRLPGISGIDLIGELPAGAPPVLLLTTFDEQDLLLKGIAAGARGFLLKDISLDKLVESISTVSAGGSVFEPLLGNRFSPATGNAAQPHTESLTEREQDVLRLIAGGYSNRDIAEALVLSEGTVKNHVTHILAKLGCKSRTSAVRRGIELGWL